MNLFFALQCACPQATEITDIPTVACLERFGEIQKVIIQRQKTGTTVNEITIGTTDPAVILTWTGLQAAVDSTKVQITPFFAEPDNDDPEPREASSTGVNGIAATLGDEFSSFTAYFHDAPQLVIKDVRTYNCEIGVAVFLVNEHGQIGCLADDNGTPTKVKGIPIQSFYVGQKKFGNRADVDKNRIQWRFLPNSLDEFYIVNPTDFNPLTDL